MLSDIGTLESRNREPLVNLETIHLLKHVRLLANDWRKLLDDGKDPMAEKNKQKEYSPLTLGEYVEIFKNDYVQRKLKASTQKTYSSRLNKISNSKLSAIPLEDISRGQVRSFLKGNRKSIQQMPIGYILFYPNYLMKLLKMGT